jgi:hypothetical protein
MSCILKHRVYTYVQTSAKYWKQYRYSAHFFIKLVLSHVLASVHSQTYLEWTLSSVEDTLAECYTILLQVALEVLEVRICPSLWCQKFARVLQPYSDVVSMLAREDVEVDLHAL